MAITAYDAVELTGDLADDGTLHDYLTEATDGDTTTGFAKAGKGGADGDAHRVEIEGFADVTVGDTVSFFLADTHKIDDGIEIQAYIDSNSVTATAKIIISAPISTGENIFTFTQAFIDELGDLSGKFAIRYQPEAQEDGDTNVAECEVNISAPAAAAQIYQMLI